MNLRLFGSILLILATSIGAALLALPIETAASGFYYSCFLLLICWFCMTLGAFYILEVNLSLPVNSNLISMAKNTLGLSGQTIAWVTYLLLLYSLLAAYLSGGTDIITDIETLGHITLPSRINTLIFLAVFGAVVAKGIGAVDWTNRILMITKFIVFFLLSGLAATHASTNNFGIDHLKSVLPASMVVITSFGFAIIIPSLRSYLKSNVNQLRFSLFIGSLVALACYLFWIFVVQGNISQTDLIEMRNAPNLITQFSFSLAHKLQDTATGTLVHLFTSVCIMTAFLAVALSLSDFLADGWQVEKKGLMGRLILVITFLPPLLITFFFPGVFIHALHYAGIFCVILLILLPALMTWQIRKKTHNASSYRVCGGRPLLGFVIALGLVLLIIGCIWR